MGRWMKGFDKFIGVPSGEVGGRVSPRRARYFFFASPKKSTQKKGDPPSGSPALRYGATCGALIRRGLAKLAALKQRDP